MLTAEQVDFYNEHGYLMVPDVLDQKELAELKSTVAGIVAGAAKVTTHTEVYDLEDGHTPDHPKVRRIKTPHRHFDFFARLVRHRKLTGILASLLGPNIRLHGRCAVPATFVALGCISPFEQEIERGSSSEPMGSRGGRVSWARRWIAGSAVARPGQ